jgi:RHS repeat-associated protein
LTDTSGALTDTFTYDAFGVLIHRTGTTPNLYLYAGEQFDPDLGLYYNRARYLNVGTGRFWTMDSFEGVNAEPLTLHKYTYASANPVNKLDPSGNLDIGTSSFVSTEYAKLQTIAVPVYKQVLVGVIVGLLAVGSVIGPIGELEGAKQQAAEEAATKLEEDERRREVGVGTQDNSGGRNTPSNVVYRALREGESYAAGIFCKDRFANTTVEQHVRFGSRKDFASKWISTTKSFSVALRKYARGDGSRIVEIDLDKVRTRIVDLTNDAIRNAEIRNPVARIFAKADAEVLIEYVVPAEAVRPLF